MAAETTTTEAPADQTFLQRHGPLLITIAVALIAIGILAAIPAIRHSASLTLHGNLDGLRKYIRSLHFGGFMLLLALILVHAVVPYPSEILTSTAGYVYGFVPGALFSICGWTVTAVLTYYVGKFVGRPVFQTLLGKRFTELEKAMDGGGARLMLVVRLLPVVPLAILGYVAGATKEPLWRLTWTSFIGYLPLTALVAYLGSQAKSLSTSNPLLWIAVVVIVLLIVGPHFYNRWSSKRKRAAEADQAPTPAE